MTKQEHLLVCLAEECAEVQKEITKILRFGLNDKPSISLAGNDLVPNNIRLENELNDVMAIVELLREEGVDVSFTKEKIQDKKNRTEVYMKYAREKGMLEVD